MHPNPLIVIHHLPHVPTELMAYEQTGALYEKGQVLSTKETLGYQFEGLIN